MNTIPCDHCEGTGWAAILPGETPRYCGSCEGKGLVQEDEPYSAEAARLAPNPHNAKLHEPRPGAVEATIRRESDG